MAEDKIGVLSIDLQLLTAEFKKKIVDTQKELTRFGKDFQKIGKDLSTAISAPLLAIGTAAVFAANKYDSAMDSIRAGTGKTGKELEGLGKSFKSVFTDSTQSVDDVSSVLSNLNRTLGLSGKPLEDLSKQVLGLAEVTGQDLGGILGSTTKLMNAWQISTKDQAGTIDTLLKV